MSKHMKRLTAPKTWPIERKATVFITKPRPGAHPATHGLPLTILLRDMLGLAKTTREVKRILATQEILVNGKKARRPEEIVGLMDVVSIPAMKAHYRILINTLNKLHALPISGKETSLIPSKVKRKSLLKSGLLQLGLHNGRTLRVKKDVYKVGGTLVLTTEGKEENYLPLEKGATVLMVEGTHVGETGTVESIDGTVATVKLEEGTMQTPRRNLFVVGKEKPAFKLWNS